MSIGPKAAARYDVADYVDYVQERRIAETADVADDADQPSDTRAAARPQDYRKGEASRVRQREAVLADRYTAPDLVTPHVAHVALDRETQIARLSLRGGGEIHDHGDRVEHHGAVSPDAAAAVVAAAAGHGWTRLAVTGSDDFREAVAVAAALREPPVETDHPLSAQAARKVADERVRRAMASVRPLDRETLSAADPRTAVAAFVAHVEARSAAAGAGRPTGSTDPVALAADRLAGLRQQTADARDTATEARQAADAHRSAYPLSARLFDASARRRQSAMDREAARLDGAAGRAERREPRDARRIEKSARAEAMAHARAAEDWRWSPAGRAAERQQAVAEAVARAVAAGDPATIAAASRGDLRAAAEAAQAPQHPPAPEPAAARPGETEEQHARREALAVLLRHETAAHADPARLAAIRTATAAVVGADPATVEATARGDLSGAVRAGEVFRERAKRERAGKEREQQLRRIAANENAAAGPAGP